MKYFVLGGFSSAFFLYGIALLYGGTGSTNISEIVAHFQTTVDAPREDALVRWCRQVVRDPNATTEADVDSLRQAGLDDREIFEATAFIAFRLAFSTINDALGARPDAQLAEKAPRLVREAVTFGRPASQADAEAY